MALFSHILFHSQSMMKHSYASSMKHNLILAYDHYAMALQPRATSRVFEVGHT